VKKPKIHEEVEFLPIAPSAKAWQKLHRVSVMQLVKQFPDGRFTVRLKTLGGKYRQRTFTLDQARCAIIPPPPAPTPEHDKLAAIKHQSQAIGEFLDWLSERNVRLADYREAKWICDECGVLDLEDVNHPRAGVRYDGLHTDGPLYVHRMCGKPAEHVPQGLYMYGKTTVDLLAEFFDIDQNKLEAEKRAMLDQLRKAG